MKIIKFYILIKKETTYYVYLILDNNIKYKYITRTLWNKQYYILNEVYYDINNDEIYVYDEDEDGYLFF